MKNKPFGEVPLWRLTVCMMAGIVVGDRLDSAGWLLPALVLLVVATLAAWRYAVVQSAGIMACCFVLGGVLVQRQEAALQVSWPEGEVDCEAVVLTDAVEKPKTMAVDILLTDGRRKLKCYLHKDERSRALRVGDGLKFQSRIRPNGQWRRGAFDYRRYLEVHGFSGQTFVASWKWQKVRVSLRGLSRLSRARLYFLKLRSRLLARLQTGTIEGPDSGAVSDAYAVVAAMALGDKSALTQQLRDVYAVTGASHVLALSGLHLGIIYTLLSLLTVGRRWQAVSQVMMVMGIWAFVFLVGMPTSVVRSATMLTAYALLSTGHRNRMSVNTLAFTALLILLFSPLSLFDVGFQMSFLAVFFILLLVPMSERLFPRGWLMEHRVVRWLWGMTAVSCAAQMGVAPLIAYYFGRVSVCFLLTNFIVVPAVTVILWLSPVVLLIPSLAYILLYIVSLLNTLLAAVATIPGASIDGLHPTITQTTMAYVVIVAVYLLLVLLTCNRASAECR